MPLAQSNKKEKIRVSNKESCVCFEHWDFDI